MQRTTTRVTRRNASSSHRRTAVTRCDATAERPKVLIAGGGIGGLMAGIACQAKGLDVTIFERVTEYKPWGGPIQLAGNALSSMMTCNEELAKKVVSDGTVTGDRVNGLLDGKSGDWFVRFDTRKPSFNNGLPLTLVMSRFDVLNNLRAALKGDVLRTGIEVEGYEQTPDGKVVALMSDGSREVGDILIGSDGIRSNVRKQMKGEGDDAVYSGYTCYTALGDFSPDDIDTVGYQVWLGAGQYFVASDVGGGRVQWYAFLAQPPGMQDDGVNKKEELLRLFDGWAPDIVDRIKCVDVEAVERRDIYDRRPTLVWGDGRVALLGDAAHAMQPNMGQGGCQAIEDAAALADELSKVGPDGVETALFWYQFRRVLRSAAIMGFARMAAIATTTYRAHLGSNPYGFYPEPIQEMWRNIEKLEIPHPGRVVGQIAMMGSIDLILAYITAGGDGHPNARELLDSQDVRKIDDDEFAMKGIPGFAK